MTGRRPVPLLPASLLLLTLTIAVCFGLWAKANTWQYNRAGIALVRTNRWNGHTEMFTHRGWRTPR